LRVHRFRCDSVKDADSRFGPSFDVESALLLDLALDEIGDDAVAVVGHGWLHDPRLALGDVLGSELILVVRGTSVGTLHFHCDLRGPFLVQHFLVGPVGLCRHQPLRLDFHAISLSS
jgi:hypothetical protein